MRARRTLLATVAVLIVGAALPVPPAEAARRRPKPPANVLEASVRVDVETGLLDPSGSWLLDVGGRSVLVTTSMTSNGKLSGVAWYDGSEIAISGRTRRTRRSQTLSLSGTSRRTNRPDARLSIRGTVDGDGEFAGTGRLTRKSGLPAKSGATKRGVAASGTTPGAGSNATVRLHLDVEPKVGSTTGASLTGQAVIRAPSVDVLVLDAMTVRGTARGTNGGDDAVRLTARNRGARLTLTGEHNGTRFTGVLRGNAGVHVFRRASVSFDTGKAPVDAGTALGSATARVTVPLDGRLDGEFELNTTKGLTLRIPDGTKIVTPTGQLLVGDIDFSLRGRAPFGGRGPAKGDVSASFDVFAFPVDEDGTAAIDAEADSSRGRGVPVLFIPTDPEPVDYASVYLDSSDERLRLTLNVGVRSEREDVPSFGASHPIAFDWGDKIAPRIGVAYDVGEKTLLKASYALYADNLLAIGDLSNPTFAAEGTGSYGLGGYTYLVDFDPGLPANEIHDVGIPGDDAGEFPKVKSVSISSVGTGQVLCTARAGGAGLGLGEKMAARSLDGTASYEFEVVGEGGGRFVRLRTPFLNAFSIRVVYCNADGTLGLVIQEPPTNPTGEVVVAGPYDGRIDVEIRGQGGIDAAAEDVFELSEAVGTDGVVVPRRFEPEAGGAYLATARVFAYTLAISTLADRLGTAFEADISAHFRRITIRRVAVLGSVLAVCGLDDNTLNFLDALTLLVGGKVKLPGRPGAVVLGPSGRRAYVTTPKQLICVDVEAARIVRSVRVRGLLPNVAMDPTGRRIYVGNSRGEFIAYDARTLRRLWSVGGFGGESVGSISLAHGGRYAYFTQPNTTPARICGVDLLGAAHTAGSRRGFNWALPCVPFAGAQAYATSHDGLRGVVSVPAFGQLDGGSLTILDTTTWTPIRTLPGLNGPIQVAWTEDDGLVIAPAFNQDALVVMDPDSGASTTVGGIDGANGLAVFRTADGMDLAYTGGFEDDTLHVFDLTKNALGAPLVGQSVNESVDLDFQPGPMHARRQVRIGVRLSFKR